MRASFRALLVGVAGTVVVGCATARPTTPPPIAPIDAPGLVVTLAWSQPVDLDLYVTTPRGETVYYANPGDAFEQDARCETPSPAVRTETVHWRTPAPGRYRVGVDFPEACGGRTAAASYRIVADLDGRRVEREGIARIVIREPAVLEVDAPATGSLR